MSGTRAFGGVRGKRETVAPSTPWPCASTTFPWRIQPVPPVTTPGFFPFSGTRGTKVESDGTGSGDGWSGSPPFDPGVGAKDR